MIYMLVKEVGIPPSELGINMKDPLWAMRYLKVIGYIKMKEQDAMKNNTPSTSGNSLEYHISEEEYRNL